MEHFSISSIIERYNPDVEELSKVLFPYIKYPKQAFDRVLRGEANLDTKQLEQLASYLGVLIADLFVLEDDWKGLYNNDCKCLTFVKGPYRVNLNYNGSFLIVYKDGKQIHQEVKCTTEAMTIQDFFLYINNLI